MAKRLKKIVPTINNRTPSARWCRPTRKKCCPFIPDKQGPAELYLCDEVPELNENGVFVGPWVYVAGKHKKPSEIRAEAKLLSVVAVALDVPRAERALGPFVPEKQKPAIIKSSNLSVNKQGVHVGPWVSEK